MARESLFRKGRSLVAAGGPAQTTIATTATGVLTWTISEDGVFWKLVIQCQTLAIFPDLEVTAIRINNDDLIYGAVPAQMFAHDSRSSPGFGHPVYVADQVTVSILNNNAGNALVIAGWATL